MGSLRLDIPLPVFFVGGFVGAFIVVVAALFLFGRGDITWESIRKVLFCAGAGGALGMVGWACGPFLGGVLWLGLKGLHLVSSSQTYQVAVVQNTLEYLSLRVVWQTGVALLLGLMLSTEGAIADTPNSPIPPATPAPRKIQRFAAILFFGAIFALLSWQVSRVVRGQMAVKHRQDAVGKMIAEAPSVEKLPSIEAVPVEKALLVEQIGGLFATAPSVFRMGGRPFLQNGAPAMPPTVKYSVGYAPVRDMLLLAVTVDVFVQQFPNAEWALYKTKYPVDYGSSLNDPQYRSIITKFGNRIVMNTAGRYPDGNRKLDFLWPNGNVVVTVRYETRNVDEEILKRYLSKYPSSL